MREGWPRVRVPVLSKTMVSMLWAVSRASAERMRTPNSAPFPVPTIMDVGVARPRAQGQAMIRTATAAARLRLNSEFLGSKGPDCEGGQGDDQDDGYEITGYHIDETLD